MELPSKISEQIAFITRPKLEEHMLVVMDRFIHDEHLSQLLKTNKKQFKNAVTFLTGYNGISTLLTKTINFILQNQLRRMILMLLPCWRVPTNDSLNDENIKIINKEGYFTEENYPFVIKPNFSTLGSIIEIKPNFIGSQVGFIHDKSIGVLSGFDSVVIYEKRNFSPEPVDIITFDDIFLETERLKKENNQLV